MERVNPPSELAVPLANSAWPPVSGIVTVLAKAPAGVYWSTNRELPELDKVWVPSPILSTARLPGVKDCAFAMAASDSCNKTGKRAGRGRRIVLSLGMMRTRFGDGQWRTALSFPITRPGRHDRESRPKNYRL